MFNMQEVGRTISDLRKKNNMTQMELAERLGISYQAVSSWERGSTMPDIAKLPDLAEIFGVTIGTLLGKESPLLESLVEDKTEEYLEENPVTVHELTGIAPLLKPTQVDKVFESGIVLFCGGNGGFTAFYQFGRVEPAGKEGL